MAELISTFKERFSKAMSIRAITPTELKDKTGISLSTISQYTSGYSKPKTERTNLIANALSVDPAWLMGFDVPMERIDQELLNKQKESRKQYTKEWNIQFFENKMFESFSQLNDENKKKSISYTENLLSNQKMDEALLPNAARSIAEASKEDRQYDEDIMDDENF